MNPSPAPTLQTVVLLLLVASLVAVWMTRLRLPYTVGLVLVGTVLGAFGLLPGAVLSPDVFLVVLLPPLLFEASFAIRWESLLPLAPTTALLATVGVGLSAVVTALVMLLALRVPWSLALAFGILVSATDPVAVVAFFRRIHVAPALRALVEGESLLNDGATVVLVRVLALALATGQWQPLDALFDFLILALGGLAVGAAVGFAGSLLARLTNEDLVEATLSLVVAYGSYLISNALGVSGVLAVVAAGSVLGNVGRRLGLSPKAREEIDYLWAFLAFVANSLVFLLLGVAVVPGELAGLWLPIAVGVAATLLGRAVAVYGLTAVVGIVGSRRGLAPMSWRHVLFWGGLRGALPVVVAAAAAPAIPDSDRLPSLVLGVVVVSLLVQGLTLEPVLSRVLVIHRPRMDG